MAYNQVKLDLSCYHYQIYPWKPDLDPSQPVVFIVVRTLIYGVKSSGNQLFSGFGKVADYAIEHFPEHTPGAETLKDDGYVDDIILYAESLGELETMTEKLMIELRRIDLYLNAKQTEILRCNLSEDDLILNLIEIV